MKTCNGCDVPPISLAAFEVEVARIERQGRFHQIIEILLIIAIVATNLAWAGIVNKKLDEGEKECSTISRTKTEELPKIGVQPNK